VPPDPTPLNCGQRYDTSEIVEETCELAALLLDGPATTAESVCVQGAGGLASQLR